MSTAVSGIMLLCGLFFYIAGSTGLLRLPDVHSRLHALTKADNLGLGFICTGLALLSGDWITSLRLLLIWLLVMAASAVSAYLIAHYAEQELKQEQSNQKAGRISHE